ncbi:transposase [Streptomyces sp. NBC_01317]|uniref:Tn3 family transposase n=1 Tax=Streptomyces sp. NBC_01317 TaxID=2903822 RepID=UPI002E156639|nr:transposase [Streptomyces sp. NBC_01317]
MRQEIHEGSQVGENWNSANKDLFYGKDGDLAGADKESQEVSMLALHLLQSALVHVNTCTLRFAVVPSRAVRPRADGRRLLTLPRRRNGVGSRRRRNRPVRHRCGRSRRGRPRRPGRRGRR